MRITPKQYVQILESIAQTCSNDTKKIAQQFVFVLRRNHHTVLFPKVKRMFQEHLRAKQSKETIHLQTVREFSLQDRRELEEKVRSVRKDPSADISWEENEDLMGGVRARFGEKGYDESIARRFRTLKEYLKK